MLYLAQVNVLRNNNKKYCECNMKLGHKHTENKRKKDRQTDRKEEGREREKRVEKEEDRE